MSTAKGRILYFARDYQRAVEQFDRTLTLESDFPPAHLDLAFALAATADYERAVQEAEIGLSHSGRPEVRASLLGFFAGLAGRHDRARGLLAELEERSAHQPVRAFHIAMIHVGLGQYDRAMDRIEQACDERDPNVAYVHLEPLLDPLRSHTRYQGLLSRMNFPQQPE